MTKFNTLEINPNHNTTDDPILSPPVSKSRYKTLSFDPVIRPTNSQHTCTLEQSYKDLSKKHDNLVKFTSKIKQELSMYRNINLTMESIGLGGILNSDDPIILESNSSDHKCLCHSKLFDVFSNDRQPSPSSRWPSRSLDSKYFSLTKINQKKLKSKSKSKSNSFRCYVCKLSFSTKALLNIHFEQKRHYCCMACTEINNEFKYFNSFDMLCEHLRGCYFVKSRNKKK